MSEVDPYLVERCDGVLIFSFNRPEHGNAIPASAVPALIALFASVNADKGVRALLIRGEGKNFSAGGDVRGFAAALEMPVEERRADFFERLEAANALVKAYLAIEVPVVAACRGGVAGGGLLYALGADYVLADDSAAFVFSHQRVGLTPDCGVSFLLPRVVGERRAAELILGAAKLDAVEAHRIGLVSRLVESDALDIDARKAADRFARAPRNVVRSAKRLIGGDIVASISGHLEAERDAIVASVGEPAFEEGVRAFLEKRAPDFIKAGA